MNNRLTKKYYVPGLISAIIIPLLFWYYGSQRIDSKVYTVMDFGLPAKPKSETANVIPESIFEPFRSWDYRKIIVKPHTAKQNKALYVSEVKNLQQRNEKETGIEFVIGDQNSYEDFITLLDVMAAAKQETYGVDMDITGHLFAVHIPKEPEPAEDDSDNVRLCGYETVFIPYNHIFYHRTGSLDGLRRFYGQLTHLPRQAYYIVFGYIILLHISLLRLVSRYLIV
jgi:hypothetical protein